MVRFFFRFFKGFRGHGAPCPYGEGRGRIAEVICLCHGGPIAEPDDAAYMIRNCRNVDGFYGASSLERLPSERAIKEQTEAFTRIRRS